MKESLNNYLPVRTGVRNGSLAELNDTPKPAVRAAGIEGIADLAIGHS